MSSVPDRIIRRVPEHAIAKIESGEWYISSGSIRYSNTHRIAAHFVEGDAGWSETVRKLIEVGAELVSTNPDLVARPISLIFERSAMLLPPTISTTTISDLADRFENLNAELLAVQSNLRAEFQRNRLNDFNSGLMAARDVRSIKDSVTKSNRLNSALDKLFTARENQLQDFQNALHNSENLSDLQDAQDHLLLAMYAQSMLIRAYFDGDEIATARQRHNEVIGKFGEYTRQLIRYWLNDKYAPDRAIDPSGELLERYIQIQVWLEGRSREEALFKIILDGQHATAKLPPPAPQTEQEDIAEKQTITSDKNKTGWAFIQIGAATLVLMSLAGVAYTAGRSQRKGLSLSELSEPIRENLATLSKQIGGWAKSFFKDITLKDVLNSAPFVVFLERFLNSGQRASDGIQFSQEYDPHLQPEVNENTEENTSPIFDYAKIIERSQIIIENFQRLETYLAEMALSGDSIDEWEAQLTRLRIDDHGIILTPEVFNEIEQSLSGKS
ncbi:MAG: hypothetical protein ACOYL5_15395 [Phototrophicaceae bacterium]|jgi:hypothetical protein